MSSTPTTCSSATHYKNDPILRPLIDLGTTKRDRPRHKKLPRASILVCLFKPTFGRNQEWHVLLTQRPMKLKSHPGEVCCPGGRQDKEDEGDDVVTALRETREEVGIPETEIDILARMETVESVGGLCVTPIVGIWKNPVLPSQLQINKDEVEACFYVPLSNFWNDANGEDPFEIDWRGEVFVMRTYHWKGDDLKTFKIWGLTAHVVYEMAQICKPATSQQQSTTTRVVKTTSGLLWRWIDEPGSSKPYWSQRYFVLAGAENRKRVLHQYNSQEQAATKSETATKKNRLPLDEEDVQVTEGPQEGDKFIFQVSILDGRIQWKLAVETEEERSRWMSIISRMRSERTPSKKLKTDDTK
ncbi:Nudix hydrolase NudL [Seminavis robusta]|uniref:Nudix hydrolase NudL n=1 Tax=Seminavis robusta TaxID=568900 RepID=A0A9N8HHK0_9STRA|nr:Nudix hydrolase NudL [Seminavis robusta]|eukprot:Sro642_g180150.1 Nudix hydrolase NudL (357) ;mRNA; f:25331-26401